MMNYAVRHVGAEMHGHACECGACNHGHEMRANCSCGNCSCCC